MRADIFILYNDFSSIFCVQMEELTKFIIFKIVRFIITTNNLPCVAKDFKV